MVNSEQNRQQRRETGLLRRRQAVNFQTFVDMVDIPCCVMSVEKTEKETCGEIRILAANQVYKAIMGPGYHDGMVYHELVPRDNKFEDYCFRAAILKQRMHAYVETKAFHSWTDQTLIPLASDSDRIGYCQFIFEFTREAETERMAAISVNTANAVVKAGLTLIRSENFEASLSEVLRVIMDEAEAKVGQILLIDHENRRAVNLCRVLSADAEPVHDVSVQTITYELLCSWEKLIGVSNAIIIQNEQDMEQIWQLNPEWTESMEKNHVRTLVLVPLRRSKEVIGYLYVLNFNTERTVEVKELVELMSFVLGSEIYNHLLLRKLEEISQIDSLTGIRNRRAMKEKMKILQENGASYGVVNIDLNGLKVVNDRDGHEAGDRMLIQGSELLSKVFYQEDLFRTGGDEFVVITDGISREAFERKVERLRRDVAKNANISFAIGDFWTDGTMDMREVFKIADEKMYADKKAFYDRHPEMRRK